MMGYYNDIFNVELYKLKSIEYFFHTFAYSFIVFFVPWLIGHPQFLVGVIVNTALIMSGVYLDFKATLPVILLPSLGVLSKGLIFGPFTIFLVYMIPFIWIGNAILVYSMKFFHVSRRVNYILSLGISASAKTVFLFSSAYVLVKLGIVPILFLTTMGLFQLYTAFGAGVVAYGLIKIRNMIKSGQD